MGCWITKNGQRIYIENCNRGGKVVLAVGIALALGASGAGAATSLGAGSASSSAGAAKGGNAKGNAKAHGNGVHEIRQRLQRARLRAEIKNSRIGTDCAAQSYGQVREFFREHPCDALARGLIEVRDRRAVALMAVAIVDMPDEAGAVALKRLIDVHGTGNITELTGDREVTFTGRFYVSRREG